MAETRNASRPAAGATREGVRLALAGIILYLLAKVVPAEIMGDAEVLVFAAIAIAAAAAGKALRNRGVALGDLFAFPLILAIGLALGLPALLGCTYLKHLEREYDSNGALAWEWKTEGSTFLGVKSVEYVIDEKSEAAQLAGQGISDNFREVALRAVEISPVLAERIVAALRPGGQLEAALASLAQTDPALARALVDAQAKLAQREAAAAVAPEDAPGDLEDADEAPTP